jgi:hypothetical protein
VVLAQGVLALDFDRLNALFNFLEADETTSVRQ